ncbi:MAG: hypothetical protein HZA46_22715 [Planctomycetales bacterium]|nr:hypothetical protein [Planctomycetales bacterium]
MRLIHAKGVVHRDLQSSHFLPAWGSEGWLITPQLDIVNANQPATTGGTAQAATAARDLLQSVNDRVRFFFCSASDDEDQTPELAPPATRRRRVPR